MFDVIVIGGGVIGGLILRELTKYQLNICMLEKASDVAMGESKANSGIAHAGFDAPVGSLKAKFNVEGNKMMEGVCAELGVKFRRNGSLVIAFS
jgi:glycerol-3-phosphate dehydrogenase